jgi:hypothetical protein
VFVDDSMDWAIGHGTPTALAGQTGTGSARS